LVLWIYSNYILQQEGRNLAKCQPRLSSTEVGLVLVAVLFAGNDICLGVKLKNILNKIKIKIKTKQILINIFFPIKNICL